MTTPTIERVIARVAALTERERATRERIRTLVLTIEDATTGAVARLRDAGAIRSDACVRQTRVRIGAACIDIARNTGWASHDEARNASADAAAAVYRPELRAQHQIPYRTNIAVSGPRGIVHLETIIIAAAPGAPTGETLGAAAEAFEIMAITANRTTLVDIGRGHGHSDDDKSATNALESAAHWTETVTHPQTTATERATPCATDADVWAARWGSAAIDTTTPA